MGRAVACFPLPIVVGIGHEQDFSVLDEIGRRCKTPTAAAALLVETVRRHLEAIEGFGANVLGLAARRLTEERRRGGEWGRRLGLAAGGLVARERVQLEHRRTRARRGAKAGIEKSPQWMKIPSLASSNHPGTRCRRSDARAGEISTENHGGQGSPLLRRPLVIRR